MFSAHREVLDLTSESLSNVLVASLLLSAALRGRGLVARALLRADLFANPSRDVRGVRGTNGAEILRRGRAPYLPGPRHRALRAPNTSPHKTENAAEHHRSSAPYAAPHVGSGGPLSQPAGQRATLWSLRHVSEGLGKSPKRRRPQGFLYNGEC